MPRVPSGILSLVAAAAAAIALSAAPPARAAANAPPDYDRDVKPILEQHCFSCHGPEKQKGGLRLDRKPPMLRGGDSGEPAIVPGHPLKSHLITLVTATGDDAMPPKGERLKPEQVALLQKWIETGAHWATDPAAAAEPPLLAADADRALTAADRAFWSFVPPKDAPAPPVSDPAWPRTSVDPFVLARLDQRGLKPSPEAPRAVLVRRLTYDLTGLPPTPDEVDAFVDDDAPDAYEKLVDRLLASPAFGERLASLWLPLARYAEDQAHMVGSDTSLTYPYAHKYRRWVVDAFNRDLPYDRFIRLQLAADLEKLPVASDQLPAKASTGNSPLATGNSPDNSPDLPALGFLGLGPKYYNRGRLEVMADEWEDRVDTVTRTTLGLTVACARCHDHKFDPISARDYHALAGVFASTKMVNKTAAGKVVKSGTKADQMPADTLHVVEDGEPQDLNLFVRGNVARKGPVVPRRFLAILTPPGAAAPAGFTQGSGRRALALAITDRANPLTARVMVNRLWGMLLGKPIVATPSNFGHSGQPPTHPELLDHLAVRFVDQNWSIKRTLRDIATSATYRQASTAAPSSSDPSNDYLAHAHRRRMTVEQWRDTLLVVAGNLQPAPAGKSPELADPGNRHRTLYANISRLKLDDLLTQFDYPDANVHAEKRAVTNTPTQKLFALNSPFVLQQARAFAARLATEFPDDGEDARRIRQAYRLLFARTPDDAELSLGLNFLARPDTTPTLTRWQQYAQALLASNETLYVD